MTSETEKAVARLKQSVSALRYDDLMTILTALERAERERDEASDGIARWMIRMSKIREAAGVGSKPMLEELPGEIAAILTRAQSAEAALAALKAEVVEVVGRLTRNMDTFEGTDSRNQADAYYCLVKGCFEDWKAARDLLAKLKGEG